MISSRRWTWVALCGIVAWLGLAGGCTNSDDLSSGVDRMIIGVELVNPSTRFAIAGISFSQITVRPVDPAADQVLGPMAVGIVATTSGGIDMDFNGTATEFELMSTLPAGVYRVDSIIIEELLFQNGTPSATPMNCVGVISTYNQVSRVQLNELGSEITFTVTEGADTNRLHVTIDGGRLADAFERSWNCGCRLSPQIPTCNPGGTCGSSLRCIVGAGESGFRSGDFSVLSPTYLQVVPNP